MSNLLGFVAVVLALVATTALFGPWIAVYLLAVVFGLLAYVAHSHETAVAQAESAAGARS